MDESIGQRVISLHDLLVPVLPAVSVLHHLCPRECARGPVIVRLVILTVHQVCQRLIEDKYALKLFLTLCWALVNIFTAGQVTL